MSQEERKMPGDEAPHLFLRIRGQIKGQYRENSSGEMGGSVQQPEGDRKEFVRI